MITAQLSQDIAESRIAAAARERDGSTNASSSTLDDKRKKDFVDRLNDLRMEGSITDDQAFSQGIGFFQVA